MRLTVHTDYALRMLMYLSLRTEGLSTIQEISQAYGISKNHLMKVAHELGRSGFIETVRGRNGGLRLARPAAEISVGGVVRACEDDFNLVECFATESNRCVITPACGLHGALDAALRAYLTVLDGYSLADIARRQSALMAALHVPRPSTDVADTPRP